MFYRLLGMIVWKGGKLFLRRRYGSAMVPRGAFVGGAVGLLAAALIGGAKARGGGSSQLTP